LPSKISQTRHMQIIQSIRDKGAAIVIAVIALSLIGFILMDAKQGGSRLFSSFSTHAGKVNGETIELAEFNKRIKQAEDMEEQRSGQRPNGSRTYQLRDQLWNQMVAEKIFNDESSKLGIDFTSRELSAILLSNDPSNPLLQEKTLTDPATGKLDLAKAQEALGNIKKAKGSQREAIDAQIIDPLALSTKVARYSGLLSASAYYPSWMQKKDNAESKSFASISYVSIPYSEISDSTIKVSDAEINDYVQKHKDLFKQEAGRMISYLSFSQLPNADDSAAVKANVGKLIPDFAADTNAKAFVARNTSVIEFNDAFAPKTKIESVAIDTITKLPMGSVYGPYVDKGSYVIAKVVATKPLPDSVGARHILIATNDPQTGQQTRDDSSAKKQADSILLAINGGANFAMMAFQFSADGSKTKGGDLGVFGYGAMVPEFNDFAFNKSVGEKGVVKTRFGYHIIEITSQKDFKPAYKVAFVGKEIFASDATINKASLDATRASAEKDSKKLADYAAKNGLKITTLPAVVKENDYSVGALQEARQLVRWAFEAEKGDVSEPFSIGDQFIVAMVDKIQEEGTQDATTARPGAEVIIRNEKKADIIIKKIGNNPTLESAASSYGKQVLQAGQDSSITFTAQIINGIGMEPKMIGASFCKDFQSKPSAPFGGTSGVYLVKVNGIQSKPEDTPDVVAQQAKQKESTIRSQLGNWYDGLKKQADVKDNRSKHY